MELVPRPECLNFQHRREYRVHSRCATGAELGSFPVRGNTGKFASTNAGAFLGANAEMLYGTNTRVSCVGIKPEREFKLRVDKDGLEE